MSALTDCEARPVDAPQATESVLDGLLRVALTSRFFRSADGQYHAKVPFKNSHVIFGLRTTGFRAWLIESFRRERGQLPSDSAVRHALRVIEGRATFEETTPAIHVRVGLEREDRCEEFYLDLGDASERAVRINAAEWTVVDSPPVYFKRPAGFLPLPIPSREGSIDLLRRYANLDEADFRLLVGWMAAALVPEGPYPILAIHGEQGSAKTTLAKVVAALIDPQASDALSEPRSTRDLVATALGGWLLVYDNISAIPQWLSDGFCRLATGGGFAGRALYSDQERHVMHAQRPVILNGIDDFVHREDLADRCIHLNAPPIDPANRRRAAEILRSFRVDRPAILGGLLDALVGGLRERSSIQLAELPRMADFACLGESVGRALGWPEGTFLAAYTANRLEAAVAALEESVLATVLLDSAALGGLANWTLSATEMLEQLAEDVPARVRASSRWPKSPRAFTNELRRIAPLLRMRGISVDFTRTPHTRLITIHADPNFDHSKAPHCTDPRRAMAGSRR
jgi:hypothetical protein